MAENASLINRCVSVHQVPDTLCVDKLIEHIKKCLENTEIKRHLEVPGAEGEQGTKRWVFELSSPEGAHALINNYKQSELENGDEYATVEYHQTIDCEIIEWVHTSSHQPAIPQRQMGKYLGPNQAIPLASGIYHNIPNSQEHMHQLQHANYGQFPQPGYGQQGHVPENIYEHSIPKGTEQQTPVPPPGYEHSGQFPIGQPGFGMQHPHFGHPGLPTGYQPRMPHMPQPYQYQGQTEKQQDGGQQLTQQQMGMVFINDPQYGPCVYDPNTGQYFSPTPMTPHAGYQNLGGMPQQDGQMPPTSQPEQYVPPTSDGFMYEQQTGPSSHDSGTLPNQATADQAEGLNTNQSYTDNQNTSSPSGGSLGTDVENIVGTGGELGQEEPEEKPTRIIVKNIPASADKESIEMFFENKRKFGKVFSVASVELNEDDKTAVVEFDDTHAVDIVLQKTPLKMNNQLIEVDVFQVKAVSGLNQTESSASMIVVENLPEDADDDTVQMFFENKRKFGETKVSDIQFEGEGKAIVTFENEEDVDRVLSKGQLKLMGRDISVDRFSLTSPEQEDDETSVFEEIEFDGTQTTLLVSGLPDTADEDYITMFFENKRRFGGTEISDYGLYPEYACALITFNEPGDLKKVLDRRPITMMKQTLTIQIYEQGRLDTVIVTGPPSLICENSIDVLEMYLSHRKSGGGDIKEIKYREDLNAVYVTFESEEVAKRVVDRSHHVVQKQDLTIEMNDPLIDKLKSLSGKQEYQQEPQEQKEEEATPVVDKTDPEEPVMVKVKGMKQVKSQETVGWYFENKNRAGGGEIYETIQDTEDEDVCYISFKDIEAAKRVAERHKHEVDGAELEVSLYTPPPMYTNKALLKNLDPCTREDTLTLYLEAKASITLVPGSLTKHEKKEDVALVTSEEDIDFPKLEDVCRTFQLEKRTITPQQVPISNCILASDLQSDVSEDTVRFYFESKRRANGGPVEKVEMDGDSCLVYFAYWKTVDDVLQQDHKIGGSKVTVRRFISCIGKAEGDHEGRKVKIPEQVEIPDIDARKVKYIKQSKATQEAFKHQMDACHASVYWPSTEGDSKVRIVCTIQPHDKDARKIVKTWTSDAKANFDYFMDRVSVFENDVVVELWEPVMQELKTINIDNPDSVALIALKKDKKITVVGMTEDSRELNNKIRKILKDAAETAEELKQQTKETVTNLKLIETKMLLADKFPVQMENEFSNLKVNINQNKNEIRFEGTVKDVQNAKIRMYDEKGKYASKSIPVKKKQQLKLYQSKQGKEYIVKKLKGLSVVGAWEVNESQNMLIIMSTKENIETVVQNIVGSVQMTTISLGKANRSAVNTDKFADLMSSVEKLYPGRVVIEAEDMDRIVIVSTDDIFDGMLSNVKRFLSENSIFSEDIGGFSTNIYKLLQEHHRDEISNIAKNLRQFNVHIDFKAGEGITVTGNAEGFKQAKKQIDGLVKQVKRKEHSFEKPGLGGYLGSPKGKDVLTTIEKQSKVVISESSDCDSDDQIEQDRNTYNEECGLQILASCKMYGIRKVSVGFGDMTDMTVNAIVNTADKKLSLAGGLGKAIVNKGGKLVERSCQSYIQSSKQLGECEVFVGHAGNLKMQNIVHIVGPVWEGGQNKEEDKLEMCVFKSLKQASVRGWKSMALPAISCGVFGYPLKLATTIMVKSVKNFFREEQDSPLEQVFLCDISRDTAQAFVDALKTEVGMDNVAIHAPAKSKSKTARRRPEFDPPPIPTISTSDEEIYESRYGARAASSTAGNKVTSGNIAISVLKAEIAKHKADVIVNTTSKNLDLNNGAVSKTILGAAGSAIQGELKSKYPKGVDYGEVAETGGHKLKCAKVVHGAVNNWDGPKAIKQLKTFVTNCLQSATDGGHSSIAFPAIGTGNLGYPKQTVAKEMFAAVAEFGSRNRGTSLTTVHFVLYPKDSATIQAFEAEEQRRLGNGSPSYGQATGYQPDIDSDSEHLYETLPSLPTPSGSDNPFGDIKVTVKQGDITKEDTVCIVNSSNESLDFSRGAVAQALWKTCGKELEEEAKKKRPKMKSNQIVTTKAPNLNCQHIIHIVASETIEGWQNIVLKCLKKAEDKRYASVALPALGTGMQLKAEEISSSLVTTLKLFARTSPKHVKEVRFVVFQKQMVRIFESAVQSSHTDGSKGTGVRPKVAGLRGYTQVKSENRFTFTFFALEMKSINDAIQKLNQNIEREVMTKDFREPIIERFNEEQINMIREKAKQERVDFNRSGGSFQIAGVLSKLTGVTDTINQIIRDAEGLEAERRLAHILKEQIQWCYIRRKDHEYVYEAFEAVLNYRTEDAFKTNKPNYQHKVNGVKHTIDFQNLEEFNEKDQNVKTDVIRRDLIKDSIAGEPPADWKPMKGNLLVHKLPTTDSAYQDILQKFNASSGGGFTVQTIKKVQNKTLWLQYEAKKKQLETQNPQGTQNERFLWHGTSEDTVDSLNAHGFNRSYCGKNATAFGDGVYFAVNADYSCQDTYSRVDSKGLKRLYYCGVLTGQYTVGKRGMRVPPNKGQNHDMYDSVTNNVNNPVMFIIFNDTQAYPFYIVTFKRN